MGWVYLPLGVFCLACTVYEYFEVQQLSCLFKNSRAFSQKSILSASWKLEDLATGLEGGTAPTWHRPYILQPAVSLITYQSGCYRHVPAFTDSFWRLSPGNLNLIDYLNNIKWLDFPWVENDQKSDLSTHEMSIYVISTTKTTSGSGRGVIGLDKTPLGSTFHRWRDAPSLMRRREGSLRLLGLKEDLCFTFDIPWGEKAISWVWVERTIDSFPTEAAKTYRLVEKDIMSLTGNLFEWWLRTGYSIVHILPNALAWQKILELWQTLIK